MRLKLSSIASGTSRGRTIQDKASLTAYCPPQKMDRWSRSRSRARSALFAASPRGERPCTPATVRGVAFMQLVDRVAAVRDSPMCSRDSATNDCAADAVYLQRMRALRTYAWHDKAAAPECWLRRRQRCAFVEESRWLPRDETRGLAEVL